jgi:hypothetical protein
MNTTLNQLVEKLNQLTDQEGCYQITLLGGRRPHGLEPHPSDEIDTDGGAAFPFQTSRYGNEYSPMLQIFDLVYFQSKSGHAPFELVYLQLDTQQIWYLDLMPLRLPRSKGNCELLDI